MSLKTLSAKTAASLDASLMSTLGYTLEQLMELAGLSVAQAIEHDFSPQNNSNVLVLCGPGNNGGDGLVAARHLRLFGYPNVTVYWPIQGKNPFYSNLHTQLELFDVNVIREHDVVKLGSLLKDADIIVDALFGFSFHPPLRAPFNDILNAVMEQKQKSKVKVIAVDVPSGWDVDEGPSKDTNTEKYMPDALVSLTAPKPCSLKLTPGVKHYLGGRFISQSIADKWGFEVPKYEHGNQFVKLSE
ncbi:hypothetical protein CANINC_002550 [Pichia inconspicua]|uniref:NAD(P)H-hydrate epimerase n=1 Tax=Pichia inconspicua TaxID=52247 RepID=A0A4T0X2M7_9ASCO|nr:hypothetical protein CANINC_002550 [[Candida] inconspicua]